MATESQSGASWKNLGQHTDLLPALGLLFLLMLMIIPLPPFLLDLLLGVSVLLGVLIMLSTFFMSNPTEFSVFPTLLLITTLFRLSLNVSSTRLILLKGHEGTAAAGHIIETFGQFAVGGNYAVGLIIFIILVMINFIVITKGAGRIAEVAARFTLDALPGKQMAIDAELNQGLIDEHQARKRRKEITLEADFYGSMDGASKFIRGDAIAGILITLINIIGGFFIGMFQRDMAMMDALSNYTILTIGDGLVGQIPALMISTAAGVLVSRVDPEAKLDKQLTTQLLTNSRLMYMTAAIMGMFAMIPGFHLTFGIIAAATYYGARHMAKKQAEELARKRQSSRSSDRTIDAEERPQEKIEDLLPVDDLSLEVGYELVPLVDERKSGEFLERVLRIRKQFALNLGILVPPVHIKDNLRLPPGDYVVQIRGSEVARGTLKSRHLLAINPGSVTRPLKGTKTKEPAFGLPALWIPERERGAAQERGYTVVDLPTVLSTHLSEIVKQHASEFLGRQELQTILDGVARSHPKVIDELIPNLLDYGTVLKVLQQLLREEVSIRDMLTILEALADAAPRTRDPEILTELTRSRLARQLTRQHSDEEGALKYLALHPSIEEQLTRSLQKAEVGSQLVLDPSAAQRLVKQIGQTIEENSKGETMPVLLTSPALRIHTRRLVERFLPHLAVMSHAEIAPGARIVRVAVVMPGAEARAA